MPKKFVPAKKLASKKAQRKIASVMREFKGGGLHSGKGGPVVKSRKQAIAIALSQASRMKARRKEGRGHERGESKGEERREGRSEVESREHKS